MKFLTDKTEIVFNELSKSGFINQFTFVGGSAIAWCLKHRLSEDLYFFTWQAELPAESSAFIKEISEHNKVEIVNLSSTYLDIIVNKIKITLFANDWSALKENRIPIQGNIYAADITLLCAMKVNALSLRAKFRDYYDLYVINKEKFSIEEILLHATNYIPGITRKIFGMQLSYIDDIEDETITHLNPRYNVTLQEIQKHFETELKKIL